MSYKIWLRHSVISGGQRYNRTAQNINFEHVRALSAKRFQEMIKDKVETTNTVFLR